MNRIFYECLDWTKPSGGVRRLYRHVEILNKHGFRAFILHRTRDFKVGWFESDAPVHYWSRDFVLAADDVLVIPEGHSGLMMNTKDAAYERVVISLNWANIYRRLPIGVDWRTLGIRDVISGSVYERDFLLRTMGLDSTVIVSGTDSNLFRPAETKICQIACMPRKNADLLHLVQCIFRSRFREFEDVPFVAIDGAHHHDVAAALSRSAFFLAVSFPEGLARPPIEAMACGCIVAGFAGRGSVEYMDHGNNCYLADDGDVLTLTEYLGDAVRLFREGRAGPMQFQARATALRYSLDREERSVVEYWTQFATRMNSGRLPRGTRITVPVE